MSRRRGPGAGGHGGSTGRSRGTGWRGPGARGHGGSIGQSQGTGVVRMGGGEDVTNVFIHSLSGQPWRRLYGRVT